MMGMPQCHLFKKLWPLSLKQTAKAAFVFCVTVPDKILRILLNRTHNPLLHILSRSVSPVFPEDPVSFHIDCL